MLNSELLSRAGLVEILLTSCAADPSHHLPLRAPFDYFFLTSYYFVCYPVKLFDWLVGVFGEETSPHPNALLKTVGNRKATKTVRALTLKHGHCMVAPWRPAQYLLNTPKLSRFKSCLIAPELSTFKNRPAGPLLVALRWLSKVKKSRIIAATVNAWVQKTNWKQESQKINTRSGSKMGGPVVA